MEILLVLYIIVFEVVTGNSTVSKQGSLLQKKHLRSSVFHNCYSDMTILKESQQSSRRGPFIGSLCV